MWPSSGRLTVLWIAAMLLLALVALVGCAKVEVIDTTPAAAESDVFSSPLSDGSKHHNLTVLTVDFDPPLNYEQLILHRQSVTLLVAVENSGSSTEREVTVRAELSTPDDPELHLSRGASVASIAPGEIQVVHFAPLGEIPYHQNYHLEVFVDPVDGEGNLQDNRKAFDIQILQE